MMSAAPRDDAAAARSARRVVRLASLGEQQPAIPYLVEGVLDVVRKAGDLARCSGLTIGVFQWLQQRGGTGQIPLCHRLLYLSA